MDEIKNFIECPEKDRIQRNTLEKMMEFISKLLVADMNQKNKLLQHYLHSGGCGISVRLLDQFAKSFVDSFLVTSSNQNLLLKQILNIF